MRDNNVPSRFASFTNMLSAEKPVAEQTSSKLLEPTMVNASNSDEEVEVSLDTKLVSYVARECDFDQDPSALYGTIQKRDWAGTIKRAEEAPVEAMTWVSRKEKDGRLRWRLLPLHSAVIFKAPERVVESLLCAYPKGAQCKDDQGMLPIHLAFRHGCNEEVVNLLLVAYPQSIDVKDRKGRIPLELAQASASPNKAAFIRALERGPTYYAVAAAATERAAVTAEQRAIFDAKLIEVKNTHKHEMAALRRECEDSKMDLADQVSYLEEELAKTQETSQVLVDHVSSLEAQLASRSDTERFLATKIATLDSSLKETSLTKENIETELRSELDRLTTENEELKTRVETITIEETEGKSKLNETESKLKELVEEYEKKDQKQSETIRLLEADAINHRVTLDNIEGQLKNKMIIEQTLATQVSTLASRLAESAADTSNATSVYAQRVANLESERSDLRATVKDLVSKLANVAECLDAMTMEQECIVKAAADHEKTMAEAAQVHAEILADARRQEELFEATQKERDLIAEILQRQGEHVVSTKRDKEQLMEKVKVMDKQMESSHKDREDLVCSVVRQRLEMRDLIKNALSVVPKDLEDDDEIIDEVVKTTIKAVGQKEAEASKNRVEREVATKKEEAEVATKTEEAEVATKKEEAEVATKKEEAEVATKKEEAEVATEETTVEAAAETAPEETPTKEVADATEEAVTTEVTTEEATTNEPVIEQTPTDELSEEPEREDAPATTEVAAADDASAEVAKEKPKKETIGPVPVKKLTATAPEESSQSSVASKATAGTEELSGDEEPTQDLKFPPSPVLGGEDRVMASRSFGK